MGCGAWGSFPGKAFAPKIPGLKETTCEWGRGLLGKLSGSSLRITAVPGWCCRCLSVPVLWGASSFAPALCVPLLVTLRSTFRFREVKSCLRGVTFLWNSSKLCLGCFFCFCFNNYADKCPKIIPERVLGSCLWQIGRTCIYKLCTYG